MSDEYKWIFSERHANCDAGRALLKVLEALADANLQEAEDEEDGDEDADYERAAEAKALLFSLATDMTYGHRWHDSDVVSEKRKKFPRG